MTTYVGSAHIQQSNRVRDRIQQIRDRFLTYTYLNNRGIHVSAYPIWANLCLITSKVRPAFLIRWEDFLQLEDYRQIMNLLLAYRDSLSLTDLDYRLYFITDRTGIIVTTYYTYYKRHLDTVITQYLTFGTQNIESPTQDLSSGTQDIGSGTQDLSSGTQDIGSGISPILGYPILEDGTYRFGIYAKHYGLDSEQLLETRYESPDVRPQLYNLYTLIQKTMHLYDPEVRITVEDEMGPQVSDLELYIPESKTHGEITETMYEQYQINLQSPDRLSENWNNDFDAVFSIGYNYHK